MKSHNGRPAGGAAFTGRGVAWVVTLVILFLTGQMCVVAEVKPDAGLVALGQFNCTACHAASEKQAAWILPKAAPSLRGLERRVSAQWLRKWLAAPHETMPGATMPDLLHGLSDAERAKAVEELTHFLLSKGKPEFRRVPPDPAAVTRGESLYHRIGCVACHQPQKGVQDSVPSAPLPRMAEKWSFDALKEFLLKPHTIRPSGRMPGMHLTDAEAFDLTHFLLRETRIFSPMEATVWHERVRSLAELDTTAPVSATPVKNFSLEVPGVNRRVSIRFAGWLRVDKAGDYTFHIAAEGASRIALDGKWTEDEDCWERESTKLDATHHLTEGWHELKVDFVRRGGNTPKLNVEWEGPGVKRGAIPTSRLRAERDVAPASLSAPFVVDKAKAKIGFERYVEFNCTNCHSSLEKNSVLQIRGSRELNYLRPLLGCLAEKLDPNVPDFHLSSEQRKNMGAALVASRKPKPDPFSPEQKIAQTMASFNCYACHSRDGVGGVPRERDGYFTSNVDDLGDEGRIPPKLDEVGDKLNGLWLTKVMGGAPGVRPYLNTRMPQFVQNIRWVGWQSPDACEAELSRYLTTHGHGHVPPRFLPNVEQIGTLIELFIGLDRHVQPVQPATDKQDVLVETGRKLAGTDGLSCIGCHRFNKQPAHALQVLDLVTTPGRLNEDWFRQFLRDPNRFHPGTRMPALWPGGRSAFPDLLGGDPDRQFAALWAYFLVGERAKFPEGLSRKNMELVVGGETVVYRGKMWEAGFRAIAAGYPRFRTALEMSFQGIIPAPVNMAFDAEEMRLALIWKGRFLDASPHWTVQGMGAIKPTGDNIVVLPHGSAFAVLDGASSLWPTKSSKELGMKFRGTQLDTKNRPTLLYSFHDLSVEDFIEPIEGSEGMTIGLRRTMKFIGTPPAGLHFRLATGKMSEVGKNYWKCKGDMEFRLTVDGAFVRGKGEKQELLTLVPRDGKQTLEIYYAW